MTFQPPPNPSKWSELRAKLVKKWQEVTSSTNKPTMATSSNGTTDVSMYLCPSCQSPLSPELHRILLAQTCVVCEACGFEITFTSLP